MNHFNPATGEIIRTDTPADWMGSTDVAPPSFDPKTEGCFWRGGRWEIVPGEVPAEPVPAVIAPLQGLLAIDQSGMSAAYEAWANDPGRTFAERAFIQRAQVWRRDDPLLIGAASALGLTEAQLDDLFRLAGTL